MAISFTPFTSDHSTVQRRVKRRDDTFVNLARMVSERRRRNPSPQVSRFVSSSLEIVSSARSLRLETNPPSRLSDINYVRYVPIADFGAYSVAAVWDLIIIVLCST